MAKIVDIYEQASFDITEETLPQIRCSIESYFNTNSVILNDFGFEMLVSRLLLKNKLTDNLKRPYLYAKLDYGEAKLRRYRNKSMIALHKRRKDYKTKAFGEQSLEANYLS